MADQVLRWVVSQWAGINVADPPSALVLRSHQSDGQGNWQHQGPWGMESPDQINADFDAAGLRQRLGSAADTDNSGLLVTNEVPLAGAEYQNPATNARVEEILTTHSIWTNESGSFARINTAGGAEYAHAATASEGRAAMVAGHLVWFMDGNNAPQVSRGQSALDDQLYNSTTTTTVDSDSSSGQKVLNVAATGPFQVHDRVIIGEGTAREETGYVASIQSGTSLTLVSNLSNTHTAAQGDTVETQNQWVEAFGGAAQDITGDWQVGYAYGMGVFDQLVFSVGDATYEWTDEAQPWDRLGGGADASQGPVVGMRSFTPHLADSLAETAFIWSAGGLVFRQGFTASYRPQRIDNAPAPMNDACIAATRNWLVYLTEDRNIAAVNGSRMLTNLGRRFRSSEEDGPLDGVDTANAPGAAFAYYDPDAEQWGVWFPTAASSGDNVEACLLDFKQGEPGLEEPLEQIERHVRTLYWQIEDPDNDAWFVHAYRRFNESVGITADGKTWTLRDGNNDLGSKVIAGYSRTPEFTAGAPSRAKQWLSTHLRGRPAGDWDAFVRPYLDGASNFAKSWDWPQVNEGTAVYGSATYDDAVYASSAMIRFNQDTRSYAERIALEFGVTASGEWWRVTDFEQRFMHGAEER